MNNAKNNCYNTQLSDIHLAQSLLHVKRHTVYKELQTMKCELCFPQTSTSGSRMNGFWSVQYRTTISSTYSIMYPISTHKKWVINTYLAYKNISTWGEKVRGFNKYNKLQCLLFQDTCNTCVLLTSKIFLQYWTYMTFAKCELYQWRLENFSKYYRETPRSVNGGDYSHNAP
jgi:hypothetical protein